MSSNLVDDGIVIVIDMIKDFLNPGEEFVVDAGRDMYPKMRELSPSHANKRCPSSMRYRRV